VSLRIYIAGAFVANAPIYLTNLILDWMHLDISSLLGFLDIIGGSISGYLVARKIGMGPKVVGMRLGLTSYLLFAALQTISGTRREILMDILALVGFISGAMLGARYWEKSLEDMDREFFFVFPPFNRIESLLTIPINNYLPRYIVFYNCICHT
jgi:hypothetical protein